MPARPWLRVEAGEPPWVEFDGKRTPLVLHPVAPSMPDEQFAELARVIASRPGRKIGLVVCPRLRGSARAVLEGLGVAYADSHGHLHLPAPGVLVHMETASTTSSVGRATPGLGPSGVRAVQLLLQPEAPAQLSRLAAQAGLSLSQTHTVLEALERAGLLRSTGTGPTRRRTVVDRTALLDWLATQPSARRREPRLDVFVYARRPEDLWRHVTTTLDAAGIAHALTGAAGAALHGAGPTAVPVTAVRIAPDTPLADAARIIGAEPTECGANLRLLRDTGQVGCVGAYRREGVAVAPRVRVYLDAIGEKRGQDLAQQFREVILGY